MENLVITDPVADLEIKQPTWSGDWSGIAYEECLKEILQQTKGTAAIRFIWEHGDSETALKVHNGKVSEGKLRVIVD